MGQQQNILPGITGLQFIPCLLYPLDKVFHRLAIVGNEAPWLIPQLLHQLWEFFPDGGLGLTDPITKIHFPKARVNPKRAVEALRQQTSKIVTTAAGGADDQILLPRPSGKG